MSFEVSSPLPGICQLVTGRLALAASDTSETEVGVQPYTLVDGNAFRDTIDAPGIAIGIAIGTGSIDLAGPRRRGDRPPQIAQRTADNALLSDYRWQRHGMGRGRDRVLQFPLLHCTGIAATLPDERRQDIVNEDKGTLVKDVLVKDAPARRRVHATACWRRRWSADTRTSMHR